MKNIIEKRKGQLRNLGIILLALSVILTVVGVVLLLTCTTNADLKVVKIVLGIFFLIIGLIGLSIGVVFTWVSSSVKATNGSIAEDNLGKGTVNMHKCENCGAEVEEGVKICAKCEENLKP